MCSLWGGYHSQEGAHHHQGRSQGGEAPNSPTVNLNPEFQSACLPLLSVQSTLPPCAEQNRAKRHEHDLPGDDSATAGCMGPPGSSTMQRLQALMLGHACARR